MTPKEKAEELVDRYWLKGITNDREIAKQCALIAVNEILNLYAIHYTYYTLEFKYWQEVKKEIEK